jgi:hypothetical protein
VSTTLLTLLAGLATAQAASPGLDLLLRPTTLRTRPVTAQTETLDVFGLPTYGFVSREETGLGGRGLALELSGLWQDLAPNRWLLSLGVAQNRTRLTFGGVDGDAFSFAPTTTDLHLCAGLLPWFAQQQVLPVDGYMVVLGGVHASTLGAEPLARSQVAFAPQLSLGMGVATRRSPVRLRVETRLDLVPHFGSGDGRVELPNSTLAWSWYPGSAALSLLVGVGLGGTHQ